MTKIKPQNKETEVPKVTADISKIGVDQISKELNAAAKNARRKKINGSNVYMGNWDMFD